ncbi:hypothetical protein NQ317_017369 [Molorchus minor]|uniref:Uncharacterized protein n=1 Tax=Molorchus minor TaxID=1323400 RepID=A0ABQ9JRH0_9CUCU|nr:hypothetical protein NQ317_017369 [Molorchus minor]
MVLNEYYGNSVYICTDSQAAFKPCPRMRFLDQECGEALEELARYKEVELVWVLWNPGKRES